MRVHFEHRPVYCCSQYHSRSMPGCKSASIRLPASYLQRKIREFEILDCTHANTCSEGGGGIWPKKGTSQSSMIDMLARANEWIESENQKINVRLIHSIPKNYRTVLEERRKHQRHLIRRSREASCHCISICSSGLLLARLPLHSIQILSITSPESFHKIMPSNIKTWTTAGNTKLEFASIVFPRLTRGRLLFFPPLLCLFLS
jgi:hypothetical protein